MLGYAQLWAFWDAAESRYRPERSHHFFSGCGNSSTRESDRSRAGYSRPAGEHHAGMDELSGHRFRKMEVGADRDGEPVIKPVFESSCKG